jgi:murein DD-endopeptidase MepM/ murein hydrolase activator NlpD
MSPRILILGIFVVTAGCSQRAPWRVVPTPTSTTQAGAPARQSTSRPALATVAPTAPADATAVAHLGGLLMPVAGGDSTRLDDSFDDPRDGGARRHHAIDIMAPRGTPVLSAGDGRILRLAKTPKGGISIYAADLEEQFVYYYAHLDRYHPNIYAGRPLMRGDTLGFVGTTGNAPPNAPHLHFQVMRMPADRKYWNGEPINPYPLLQPASAAISEDR